MTGVRINKQYIIQNILTSSELCGCSLIDPEKTDIIQKYELYTNRPTL